MSDERPVEELIGWERPIANNPLQLWATERGGEPSKDRAEVDDLAAWIVAQGFGVSMFDRDDGGYEALVVRPRSVHVSERGPTIRDALIAAVRKVAAK